MARWDKRRGRSPGILPRASLLAAAMVLVAIMEVSRPLAAEQGNLLVNGELSSESSRDAGRLPAGWKAFASPGCGSRFVARGVSGAPAEVEISNSEPNEASLSQSITLEAGWYRLSGEVRTEEVSRHSGAYLYIAPEDSVLSLTTGPVRGTQGWRRIALLFKTAVEKRPIVVGCRLGLPTLPATGTAVFRNLSLVRVEPSSTAASAQDIDRLWAVDVKAKLSLPILEIRPGLAHSLLGPLGGWGVAGFFGLLIALAIAGWRALANDF